jgi:hypothetical protein
MRAASEAQLQAEAARHPDLAVEKRDHAEMQFIITNIRIKEELFRGNCHECICFVKGYALGREHVGVSR